MHYIRYSTSAVTEGIYKHKTISGVSTVVWHNFAVCKMYAFPVSNETGDVTSCFPMPIK